MALKIVNLCVSCHACSDVCPNDAIYATEKHFKINPKKCSECETEFADPQCASICPIEGAITNKYGEALNPLGSLTGIPVEKLQAYAAQYTAH